MKSKSIKREDLERFRNYLYEEEKSEATINKYMRDLISLYDYLHKDKVLNKDILLKYKTNLIQNYKTSSVNSMLVAINNFLVFLNLSKLKLRLLKIQKAVFYEENKELTKKEYKRLLATAKLEKNEKLYYLLQTICGTGIRVSEHCYITVEALKEGKAVINNKGKIRSIFIPNELRISLLKYCKYKDIKKGCVFATRSGKPMDRSNIWCAMKKLCQKAQVDKNKVFPHNLRHLFALTYYRLHKDVVRLADILGHTSVDTTRIYTMIDGKECQRSLSKMNLVEGSIKKQHNMHYVV